MERVPKLSAPRPPRPRWMALACLAWLVCAAGCSTSYYGRRVQYRIEPQYAVGDAQFVRSLGNLVGPPIIGGNRVTCYNNGVEIFPAMLAAIRSAQKTINLETYIYWSGDVGQQFADALSERARAGVKVHVLIDWIGSRKINSQLIDQMREAGAEVEHYNPAVWYNPTVWYRLVRINHRDHRKLLIVDGQVGFTGGVGMADLWKGNADAPEFWRDMMFRLEGPAVAQMQAAFMDNWVKTSPRVLDGEDYFPELAPAGGDFAQVFFSSPRDGTESVRLMYLLSIAAARKNIRLAASYFVPGSLTIEELVEARQRGVAVEIILPGSQTDSPTVRNASRAKWGPLLAAGVKIYEYQPTMYHCKMMIVDDQWVSVGSANFDNRSFRLNDEANLNILSAAFAEQQVRVFEEDKRRAHEITHDDWKSRSTWKRIKEALAAPFRSQL